MTAEPSVSEVASARTVVLLAALVIVTALVVEPPDLTALPPFVLVCGLGIVAGELVPGLLVSRSTAPISTAAAMALVMAPVVDVDGAHASAAGVVGVVGACYAVTLVLGALLGRARSGWSPAAGAARFLGATATALACRGISSPGRGHLVEWVWDGDLERPLAAGLLVLAATLGWSVERAAHVVGHGWAQLADDGGLRRGFVLDSAASGSVVASAPMIALSYPILGLLSLPLYLLPISLVLFSVRRYTGVQEAQREALLALSQLPVVAAGVRPGHAAQVAELSVAVARRMGLRGDDLRSVERAALLHDIGQVGLPVPLEHGATIEASAPAQDAMAAAARRVTRAALDVPGLDHVLATVHTPYRHRHETGQDLPVEARIIKVVNAFDDLTEGAQGRLVVDLAMQRLHLGLGYEYDPEVVEALEAVVAAQPG